MRRLLMVVAVAGLVASACSSSSTAGLQPSAAQSLTPASCTTKGLEAGAASAGPSGEQPVTINLWSFYSSGEFKKYCEVLQDFHQKYPWISIQHTGGKSDQAIFRAVNSDTAPDVPKTLSQLEADAKKLTVFNPDGSIKVAGYVPLQSFYESTQLYNGDYSGGIWYDQNGNSAFASDPSWANLLQWEKSFIADVYGSDGYHKLQEFFSKLGGPDSEWSSAHGFETEQVAMMMDGEWRNAFIADDGSNVNYGTAPFPVADDTPDLYGAGQIGGDVVGIPSNAKNPDAAWLLLKYLALDTGAEIKLATILKNVPTTFESLKDPGLNSDEHFKVFLQIFGNEHSAFKPLTPIGSTDADLWDSFIDKWEAGSVSDLQTGLQDLATQIDDQLQLG